MKKTLYIFCCAFLLVGCQTDPEAAKTTQQKPQFGHPESSIPWNKPEDWEEGGQLGGMMPNGGFGGQQH
jgi:hypothetical protein